MLADLALISMMAAGAAPPIAPMGPAPRGPALAIYRAGSGAPPLRTWLSLERLDPRQRVVVVAHYSGGRSAAVAGRALQLVAEAQAAGQTASLILEPARAEEIHVQVGYDAAWHEACVTGPQPDTASGAETGPSCP